jgi:hypothetical protein
MTIQGFDHGAQIFATAMQIFDQFDITIEIGSDFNAYQLLLLEHRSQQPLGPPFDPKIHQLNAENAFWLAARGSDSRVIHTQSMRVLDLKSSNLENHLRESFRDFPPVGPDIDLAASRYRAGPGAQKILGRVCYHGELWMDDSLGAYRGSGLSAVLGRFAFLTCIKRFSPDYVFGFVARSMIFKGLAERLGYMHSEPASIRWRLNNKDWPLEGFMVWMARDDLKFMMTIPLIDLVA